MNKCTRNFYEETVDIRSVKLAAANDAYKQLMGELVSPQKSGGKIAIIGGGPAGLAAAYFLARAGRPVTLFEKADSLGGIVKHIIPEFRIPDKAIKNDVDFVLAMGIEVKLNAETYCLSSLRSEGFEKIIIATGAREPIAVDLENGSTIDALEFLAHLKHDSKSPTPGISSKTFGKNIAVIGGGNTAMDTARAAKRIPGVSQVSLVYRRTKRYMPADAEELELAIEDGVEFYELLAPKSHKDGNLTCTKMKLGEPDASGRRSPVATDEIVEVPANTVIAAVGYKSNVNVSEEDAKDVFVIGDAARGPATIAEAIADASECAAAITGIGFDKYVDLNLSSDLKAVYGKKGILHCDKTGIHESERCLECLSVCENCVEVCPNRANISLIVDGRPQIVHIDFMCNECGNCEVFCPYSSAPYLDKLTFFIFEEDFANSENSGFLPLTDGSIRIRLDGKVSEHRDGSGLPDGLWRLIEECLITMKKRFASNWVQTAH